VTVSRSAFIGLLIAALLVRLALLDLVLADQHFWVLPWYEQLRSTGWSALGQAARGLTGSTLGSYTPPYYYLLYLATFTDGVLQPLHAIKGISIAFDCVTAAAMFHLVRHVTGSTFRARLATLAVLFAPTVVANSAAWGQIDGAYTSLLVLAVYFSVTARPVAMFTMLGLAVAFKAQTVFLAPYVLLLWREGRWRWPHAAVAPLAWLAAMLPAMLAGRSIVDLALVYVRQGGMYHKLSMNAPNLYYLMPDSWYGTGVGVGLAVSVMTCLVFAFGRRRMDATPRILLLAATAAVLVMPFVLPKMHDRYFMPADVLSIGLAFVEPQLWFVPVALQVSSGLSYVPAITDAFNGFNYEYVALMPLAVAVNVWLVPYVAVRYWRGVPETGSLRS
jgi:Gpi18-like mannosyltransferase